MSEYKALKGIKIKTFATDLSGAAAEGQVFFSTATQFQGLKTVIKVDSWAGGGNLTTGRGSLAGAGIQTAALVFGGSSYPPLARYNSSEEYNGSAWTEGNNLGQARNSIAGCGTQTAGLGFGGRMHLFLGSCSFVFRVFTTDATFQLLIVITEFTSP